MPSQLLLSALPEDALIQILMHCSSDAIMPVSTALRDLYRNRARSVTIRRGFVPGTDNALVDAMRCSPCLDRVVATYDASQWRCGKKRRMVPWPLGRLANISFLTVPVRWPLEEIPSTLQRVDLVGSVGLDRTYSPAYNDVPWVRSLLERLGAPSTRCLVRVGRVEADANSDLSWLQPPSVEVPVLSANGPAAVAHAAAVAEGCRVRELSLRSCTKSGGGWDLRCLRTASSVTTLRVTGPAALRPLVDARLPALLSMTLSRMGDDSLGGITGARWPTLTGLRLNSHRLTSLQGLEGAHVTALRSLDLKGAPLLSLHSIGRALPHLTHFRGHGLPELTTLAGLAHGWSALQKISLMNCGKLESLQGLHGARFWALTKLKISNATRFSSLAGLSVDSFGTLQTLALSCCGLTSLRGLEQCDLSTLEQLELGQNHMMKSLEGLPRLPRLRKLVLEDCPLLEGHLPLLMANVPPDADIRPRKLRQDIDASLRAGDQTSRAPPVLT